MKKPNYWAKKKAKPMLETLKELFYIIALITFIVANIYSIIRSKIEIKLAKKNDARLERLNNKLNGLDNKPPTD
jgi:hypothetical protein